MRSIELTLDDEADAAFRRDWRALHEAGLPSLADHTGGSNRPHLTLAVGEELADGQELREAFGVLPVGLRFGGIVLFGLARDRFVLARQVIVSSALIDLHRRVHLEAPGAAEQTAPDRWTPHITLSRRLPAADLPHALSLLVPLERTVAIGARLWDGREKTITELR